MIKKRLWNKAKYIEIGCREKKTSRKLTNESKAVSRDRNYPKTREEQTKHKTRADETIAGTRMRSVQSCRTKRTILQWWVLVKMNEITTVKIILVETKATEVIKTESTTITGENIVGTRTTSV